MTLGDPERQADLILVIDDDEGVAHMLGRFLGDQGYAVRLAVDGETGLVQAVEFEPSLVLLDLRLPGMDGLECLRRLRAQGCRAPVVMMTGYGDVQTAVEAMKIGASDFLEKPFKLERLAATIEGILARQERPPVYDDPVVAYVQRYSSEINSRGQVATRLGISQEQVSKRVQSVTGLPFRRFLHICRLETAKHYLRTSDLPISQVAARTGFQTIQHFSRVFRTHAGVSPRTYRLKSRVAPSESPPP